MKRWLCRFFLAVGVVLLLWILHHQVSSYLHPAAQDPSVLTQNQFTSRWCRALRAASPAFPRNRAGGPLESFARHSAFLITDDVGPPWLDHRGPPGPNACSQGLVTKSCRATGQAGGQKGVPSTFQRNSGSPPGESKIRGFATRFS